jgi:hypothetical protein
MRVSPFAALMVSFLSWLGIGVFLLHKGLNHLVSLTQGNVNSSLMQYLQKMCGGMQQAILFCICIGLFVGFLKGRFVLIKTVHRLAERFFSFSQGMKLKEMYPLSYVILISSMMLLGMSMKWIPISQVIKGTLDVAVGAALINGSLQYFRIALTKGRKQA